MNTKDGFEISAKLVLDITHHANLLENLADEDLLVPPSGIYITGQLEPAMIDGRQYYCTKGAQRIAFSDINEVDTSVYDENDNLIIRSLFMKNKAKHLSNTPLLPYRGLKIATCLCKDYIDSKAVYRKFKRNPYDEIVKHFKPNIDVENKYSGKFDEVFSDIRRDIGAFIGSKEWNLHFITLKNTLINIEQGLDYRAWCWENEHGKDFRAGKYVEFSQTYQSED